MPDKRTHRGAAPQDRRLFATDALAGLRAATGDLSWLLGREYAEPSSRKLVGDRYGLTARQRNAVARCACSDEALRRRREHCARIEQIGGQAIWLDGYNVLTTVETALAGGVVLAARDGTFRDIASVHGTWRKVHETEPAIDLIGRTLAELGAGPCRWYLDKPVSNSGRLKQLIGRVADANGWEWDVQLVADPDPVLGAADQLVATADSVILDGCARWVNLARAVIERHVPEANVIDLQVEGPA